MAGRTTTTLFSIVAVVALALEQFGGYDRPLYTKSNATATGTTAVRTRTKCRTTNLSPRAVRSIKPEVTITVTLLSLHLIRYELLESLTNSSSTTRETSLLVAVEYEFQPS